MEYPHGYRGFKSLRLRKKSAGQRIFEPVYVDFGNMPATATSIRFASSVHATHRRLIPSKDRLTRPHRSGTRIGRFRRALTSCQHSFVSFVASLDPFREPVDRSWLQDCVMISSAMSALAGLSLVSAAIRAAHANSLAVGGGGRARHHAQRDSLVMKRRIDRPVRRGTGRLEQRGRERCRAPPSGDQRCDRL